MYFWQKHSHSKPYFILILALFSIALSGTMSLFQSVGDQSLLEQKSLTPAFDLVTHEILKPLFIAETVARASPLKLRLSEDIIDEKRIVTKLGKISEEFGMVFFVASEKSLTQYNSDGTTLNLQDKNVSWYSHAKNTQQGVVGVLCDKHDTHVYFNVKVHDQHGEFIGFIGISKMLESFISSFENFKQKFNYEFIFVDQNDDVVLSSDETLMTGTDQAIKLQEISWFQALSPEQKVGDKLNDNLLVSVEGEDLLIAKADISALNWKLFLVHSLNDRQHATAMEFILQTLHVLFVLLLILLIGRAVLPYIQAEFAKRHQKDPLTKLPNRAHLSWRFGQLIQRKQHLSVVIVDIDHFKKINDDCGHAAGDIMLCQFAQVIHSQLRDIDVVGRWGGEEFIIIVPSSGLSVAADIAERTRLAISQHGFAVGERVFNITASFGVAYSDSVLELEDLVARADKALYLAKHDGRNVVRTAEDLKISRVTEAISLA